MLWKSRSANSEAVRAGLMSIHSKDMPQGGPETLALMPGSFP